MKIAQFILSMSIGGGERLVRTLSQQLKIPGFAHCVVCFDRITHYQDEFAEANVPLTLIKRRQCFFDWKIVKPLVQLIRNEKIRLIHAHDLTALTYGVVAGKLCGAKVMMTEHSRHYVEEAWKRRLEKWVFIMGSDRLVEVSPVLRDASMRKDRIPAGRIEVIENGVDIRKFQNAAPLQLRQQLGISNDASLILAVGRLEIIKGQHHLIKAMALTAQKNEPIHLILAGDGTQKAYLKRQSQKLGVVDRVHFLGPRQDIPELMASCDLLVIPSESEGLPFVLLEAMASGLPVVSAAVGRIPQIIGKNERGILVPPRNSEAMATAIWEIVEESEKRRQMVERATSYLQVNYSQKMMLSRYAETYKTLLQVPKKAYRSVD